LKMSVKIPAISTTIKTGTVSVCCSPRIMSTVILFF
jgi:hypothetical protein